MSNGEEYRTKEQGILNFEGENIQFPMLNYGNANCTIKFSPLSIENLVLSIEHFLI
jgi:predicted metalloenzyme YecM